MEEKLFLQNLERKKKAIGLIHRVYLTNLKNSRSHTAFTKTKSEVRGGGKKPWRQKGTGNARAGSTRSPLFVGGGVIFGPKPHLVSKKINKKENRLAILSAFYLRKKDFLFFEESLFETFDSFKTKEFLKIISQFEISNEKRILLILAKPNRKLWLASKNIKNIEIVIANCLNLKQLLHTHQILLSSSSLDIIHSTYGKQYA